MRYLLSGESVYPPTTVLLQLEVKRLTSSKSNNPHSTGRLWRLEDLPATTIVYWQRCYRICGFRWQPAASVRRRLKPILPEAVVHAVVAIVYPREKDAAVGGFGATSHDSVLLALTSIDWK